MLKHSSKIGFVIALAIPLLIPLLFFILTKFIGFMTIIIILIISLVLSWISLYFGFRGYEENKIISIITISLGTLYLLFIGLFYIFISTYKT